MYHHHPRPPWSVGVALFGSYLLLLCGLALSCGDGKKTCQGDASCAQGEICVKSVCQVGCRDNSACTGGLLCINTQCTQDKCAPGDERTCFDGKAAPGFQQTGLCRPGIQYCLKTGSWSPCTGQILPGPEICDREDNDCNGTVDENIACDCAPGSQRACYAGPPLIGAQNVCKAGTQSCLLDGLWGPCLGQVLPSPEICDGLDNNCNGQIDELGDCGCTPGQTRSCYGGPPGTLGVGPCKAGNQQCGPTQLWGPCEGEIRPQRELHAGPNGIDDDCNGKIDDVVAFPPTSESTSEPAREPTLEPSPERQEPPLDASEPLPTERSPEPSPPEPSAPTLGRPCTSDADCAKGQLCQFLDYETRGQISATYCFPPCERDSDCAGLTSKGLSFGCYQKKCSQFNCKINADCSFEDFTCKLVQEGTVTRPHCLPPPTTGPELGGLCITPPNDFVCAKGFHCVGGVGKAFCTLLCKVTRDCETFKQSAKGVACETRGIHLKYCIYRCVTPQDCPFPNAACVSGLCGGK